MAKRNELTNKLSGKAPGWRDMIPSSAPKTELNGDEKASARKRKNSGAPEKKIRKTYYLRETTITRIEELSLLERVGISDLVEFGLTRFLDLFESGQIKMKTETKEVRQIIY